MKQNKKALFLKAMCMLAFGIMSSKIVYAEGLSIGGGVLFEEPAYRDYDTQIYPMPVINYDSRYFFFKGASAGVYAVHTETDQLYAQVAYLPTRFKASKTDHQALKQLDDRKASVMAGLGYTHKAGWGNIHTRALADISGHSKGVIADVSYGYPFQFDKFYIEPSVGVQWQNSKHNNYYYGVSDQESQRSGLNHYSANSGSTPYLAVNAHYSFYKNWQAFVTGRYTRLSNSIKDSPMTEGSSRNMIGIGILYHFD
ncbi:MipA/OmpV family protein [Neisseria sp. Ec49-e6-T10]|uniref:MipA/OmpV family protein n=1 Tax=Neisseria sp. Ec49-e6-T10 TaxID=3140744 RepID=UPI003EC0192B